MNSEQNLIAIKQELIDKTRNAFSEYLTEYMKDEESQEAYSELNEYRTQAITSGHLLMKFFSHEDLDSIFSGITANAIANARKYANDYEGCGFEVNDDLVAHAEDFFKKT